MIDLNLNKTKWWMYQRYIPTLFRHATVMSLLAGFFLTGCVDDLLIEDNQSVKDPTETVFDGDAISFSVKLDRELSTRGTRGVEDYDNYIDTKHKFRVLFFKEDGNFLFGATDRTVTELPNSTNDVNWYVRIPINHLEDKYGNRYPVEKIKGYLKGGNKFKIAILANWPNQDVEGNVENSHPEPDWNVVNCDLYDPNDYTEDEREKIGSKKVKNINDLHHLYHDKYYSDNVGSSGRPTRLEVYGFSMKKDTSKEDNSEIYKSGINTDWVRMRGIDEEGGWKATYSHSGDIFNNKDEAEDWIRTNWNPEYAKTKDIYRNYKDLWYLWDFDASCKSNKEGYDWVWHPEYWDWNWEWVDESYDAYKSTWSNQRISHEWGKQWFARNGEDLKAWLNQDNNTPLTTEKKLGSAIDSLSFNPTQNSKCYVYNNGGRHGIVLKPAEEIQTNENGKEYLHGTKSHGYLKFTAKATGTYRIKCGNVSKDKQTTIVVQLSTNKDKEYTPTSGYEDFKDTNTGNSYRDLSITGGPEPIYIWCKNGDAVIYSIEYICSKYLYDTDRIGVSPSEDNPIPMYGVQEFQIPENSWEDGSTYDLTNPTPNSTPLYISLIRSLAKVELFIQTKAKNVYMRSMNRMSRVEPIDVESSTGNLWKNHERDNTSQKNHCEWFDIYDYGPIFTSTNEPSNWKESNRKDDLPTYRNQLSWFYGAWENWWTFSPATLQSETYPYPHLFNSDIERSDFCQMIDVGPTPDGYYKYVLYMPEKNVTDPNYPGLMHSIAKLAHIEYRYDNDTDYLEDDECSRVYFTDYEGSTTDKNEKILTLNKDQYETEYEQDKSNLKMHWPVMRNHKYQFYVGGTGNYRQSFRVKVSDWGYKKVEVEW